MAILLLRHGETAGNRDRFLQLPDTPLSELGVEQARRVAARLAEREIGHILASDFSRARRTAECIGEVAGRPVELEPLLQERCFGELRGRRYADLEGNPFRPGYTPPGGESWAAFHERVDAAWARIRGLAQDLEGDLVVVTHGLVLHSLAARHLELPPEVPAPPEDGPPMRFGNTALSVVTGPDPWRAEVFGCIAHLIEMLREEGGIA